MPKRLNKTQRQMMLEIIEFYNNNMVSTKADMPDDMPTWFLNWPLYSAGENMPGYMPDSPYSLFLTRRAAIGYCRSLESEDSGSAYVTDLIPTSLAELLS